MPGLFWFYPEPTLVTMDLSQSVVDSISSSINSWLQEHLLIWWIVSNPGWSLVILLLLIALFVGLLGAIGRSVEQFWLWLLQKPLHLLAWLWQILTRWQPVSRSQTRVQRVDFLIKRISQIQQEQDKLLKELTQMVKVERQ
jgi:hypothetical protein